jgi:hypothetical protein
MKSQFFYFPIFWNYSNLGLFIALLSLRISNCRCAILIHLFSPCFYARSIILWWGWAGSIEIDCSIEICGINPPLQIL